MGIATRFATARGTLFSLSIGLGLTGCAQPARPVAADKPTPANVAEIAALTPPAGTDDGAGAVADAVNDNVSRVDQILRRRAEAQQLADDVHALRDARAMPAAAPTTTRAEDADEIERLAAEIRELKNRDAARRPATPDPAVARATPPDAVSGTIATPTQIEMRRNNGLPAVDPLVALDARFSTQVAEDPKSLDAQLGLQLVRFLKNDPVPSEGDLASLQSEDKELLSSVCDALSNFRNVVRASPNPMTSEKARPFVDMADRIRARADLNIQNVALCLAVRKFGDYDPIEPLRFAAGADAKAVFYCEVDGFQSLLGTNGRWDTKLSLGLKLYDSPGVELWSSAPLSVTDSSRRRRRDFFIGKVIQLPSSLAPGRYLLKVTVRDLQGNRVDESTLQVDIVAK